MSLSSIVWTSLRSYNEEVQPTIKDHLDVGPISPQAIVCSLKKKNNCVFKIALAYCMIGI